MHDGNGAEFPVDQVNAQIGSHHVFKIGVTFLICSSTPSALLS